MCKIKIKILHCTSIQSLHKKRIITQTRSRRPVTKCLNMKLTDMKLADIKLEWRTRHVSFENKE